MLATFLLKTLKRLSVEQSGFHMIEAKLLCPEKVMYSRRAFAENLKKIKCLAIGFPYGRRETPYFMKKVLYCRNIVVKCLAIGLPYGQGETLISWKKVLHCRNIVAENVKKIKCLAFGFPYGRSKTFTSWQKCFTVATFLLKTLKRLSV